MSDLENLARPFVKRLIHSNPSGGGTYVSHDVVTQKLLAVIGPFSWERVELIRGNVAGIPPNPSGKSQQAKDGMPALVDVVVGGVWRLTATIDGRQVSVESVGDCEQPHNWRHDGARGKDVESDCLKRCAMRFGVGLHLWSQEEYFLYDYLTEQNAPKAPAPQAEVDKALELMRAHNVTEADRGS
jgi:hypothetical protein